MAVAHPSDREIPSTCGFMQLGPGWEGWVMKNRFLASLAVLTLALSGAFSISAFAQTTDEGPGPSEQPSAPMEIGQDQIGQDQAGPQAPPSDAQPTEAQPGGPSGEIGRAHV